jgi:hypothetical protein
MITRQASGGWLLAFLCALGLASFPADAQRATRRCSAPDTSAEWFRRQRDWLADTRHDWSDDAFRGALLSAAGVDASHPLAAQLGAQLEENTAPADSGMLARLRTLAGTRGSTWPTRSVVGAAGVRAVWLLTQRDTALQRTALHRMMESGPDEALPADVAVMEDRVRLQSGRKQLYGSQLRSVGRRLAPAPTEDSAHVDMRRDAAGLPPLRQAMCVAR